MCGVSVDLPSRLIAHMVFKRQEAMIYIKDKGCGRRACIHWRMVVGVMAGGRGVVGRGRSPSLVDNGLLCCDCLYITQTVRLSESAQAN